MNAVLDALEEDPEEARKIAAYVERLKEANPLLISGAWCGQAGLFRCLRTAA